MQEIWKATQYPGYEVSNLGRVRGPQGVRKLTKSQRYICVSMSCRAGDDSRVYPSVHSLVLGAFVGPCPEGHEINHKDGDKHNNRLDNLEYCTKSENISHRFRVLGHNPTNSKRIPLTEIMRRWKNGESALSIAATIQPYVSQVTISKIVRGSHWSTKGIRPHLVD